MQCRGEPQLLREENPKWKLCSNHNLDAFSTFFNVGSWFFACSYTQWFSIRTYFLAIYEVGGFEAGPSLEQQPWLLQSVVAPNRSFCYCRYFHAKFKVARSWLLWNSAGICISQTSPDQLNAVESAAQWLHHSIYLLWAWLLQILELSKQSSDRISNFLNMSARTLVLFWH